MKKIFILFAILLFSSLTTLAQDALPSAADQVVKLLGQNGTLTKQVNRLRTDSTNLSKKIKDLDEEIKKLKQKDENRFQQILQDSLKKYEKKYKSEISVIEVKRDSLQEVVNTCYAQLKRDSLLRDSLKEYRTILIDILKQNVNGMWASLPYASIDSSYLIKQCQEYEQYAKQYPDLAEEWNQLQELLREYRIYYGGCVALQNAYDQENVDAVKSKILKLSYNVKSEKRREELEQLSESLENYYLSVLSIQKILTKVEKEMNNNTPLMAIKRIVQTMIDEIMMVRENPWTNDQWKDFWKLLEENEKSFTMSILKESKVYRTVMSINLN